MFRHFKNFPQVVSLSIRTSSNPGKRSDGGGCAYPITGRATSLRLRLTRGRIGRGNHAGFCGVLLGPVNEQGRERLEAFAASTDGFELAERDFEFRGRATCLAHSSMAYPLYVLPICNETVRCLKSRHEAQQWVTADPGLKLPDLARLQRQLLLRYGKALELGDVGKLLFYANRSYGDEPRGVWFCRDQHYSIELTRTLKLRKASS